ncbi:KRAB-A domain-containing protein 2-like [Palaemon carinicauda]|uniref:KRAB-A domain-containing protein 2-like n=1 Tax=Palaemon carinicauda TaxID=392227 RepID=UPI0035B67AE7
MAKKIVAITGMKLRADLPQQLCLNKRKILEFAFIIQSKDEYISWPNIIIPNSFPNSTSHNVEKVPNPPSKYQRLIIGLEKEGRDQIAIHRTIGHRGRTGMCKATKEKYANISREQITLFLQYYEECQLKKSSVRKSVVVKPIVSNSMNSRAQVDLIDMQSQPDGKYHFIFNYQDHLTKMICLRALHTKTAEEVAFYLVDIFCDKGAPHILKSDNGREFSNKVIKEVLAIWPECKLVHGKPRYSQSQGSVEQANRDVEAILACWMKDNNTIQWSVAEKHALPFWNWQDTL